MLSSDQKNGIMGLRPFLLMHFFICSIGLLGLVRHLGRWIVQATFVPLNTFVSYSEWAVAQIAKPSELLQYALSVSSMVLYYIFVYAFIKGYSDLVPTILKKIASTRAWFICYGALLLLLNATLVISYGRYAELFIIFMIFWLLALIVPFLPIINYWLERMSRVSDLWSIAILGVLIASLGLSFYPFISAKMMFSNDFMDIPEQTILSSGLVDNTEYINTHRIGGLNKYDPRVAKGEIPPHNEGESIKLKKSQLILKFVEGSPRKFAYDDRTGTLVVKELLESREVDELAMVAIDEVERDRIYAFYFQQLRDYKNKRLFSSEEIEFLRINKRELIDQALAGHYFHHQNTMLGTINEYDLGKPRSETVFTYGWLSTVVIAEVMKSLGGITFESYQQVFYAFYPLYYLLTIAAAAILFKKTAYVLLVGVISIGSLYMLGFDYIRFAPGFNPIRHFFDIFALVCFCWYLFSSRRNWIYLALALIFSIVGIIFNKEFGIVLLLSMQATVAIRIIAYHKKAMRETILLGLSILGAVASLLLITTAANPTLLYVLLGVSTPIFNYIKMLCWLTLFSATYVFLIVSWKNKDNWTYLTLFWFLYAQGLFIYYIWNPAPNHFWNLVPVIGLLLALLLKCCCTNIERFVKRENVMLLTCNILLISILLIPGAASYCMDKRDYQKIFKYHKLYKWDFPRAQFVSTMDPGVFKNAVRLISKYSSSNKIYLLSKYDNILPFLSGKYSAMPFTEMGLSLVTNKELDRSVKLFQNDRPEFIFVDTDMCRSHIGDIYSSPDLNVLNFFFFPYDMADATRGRALVLDNFAKVFKEIQYLYEPVEPGQLVTVYKLRSTK